MTASFLHLEVFLAFMKVPHFLMTCALLGAWELPAGAEQELALSSAPAATTTTAKPAASPSHELAPNDMIEIKVFQEAELDTTTRVADDGKIAFPLIGQVAVSGKTAHQAALLIRDRLEARFLVNPQVSLAVIEPARRLFTVLGQVQRPGTYRFPDREPLNLLQVVGIAGGFTRLADPGRIIVKRRVGDSESILRVDAKRMARETATKSFAVLPGDLINVAERAF